MDALTGYVGADEVPSTSTPRSEAEARCFCCSTGTVRDGHVGPVAFHSGVLTPPDGLSDDPLVRVLSDGWGLGVAELEYRAVGFGSHHWEVVDADGVRRFLTVDDLWMLDRGDGCIIGAYADATGTTPRPSLLELYRLRWDLADIAVYVGRFQRGHSGNQDDEKSWDDLCSLMRRLPA
jgi:hypothetical protein